MLAREQFFLGIVAEHANQSGIHLEDLVVWRNDVDAFLKGFEEFGETGFAAALGSDVASEDGEAVNLVVAEHGVSDAIEEVGGVRFSLGEPEQRRTNAALKEALQAAL